MSHPTTSRFLPFVLVCVLFYIYLAMYISRVQSDMCNVFIGSLSLKREEMATRLVETSVELDDVLARTTIVDDLDRTIACQLLKDMKDGDRCELALVEEATGAVLLRKTGTMSRSSDVSPKSCSNLGEGKLAVSLHDSQELGDSWG